MLSPLLLYNEAATSQLYALSLHDALPISGPGMCAPSPIGWMPTSPAASAEPTSPSPPPCRSRPARSEEHTSELQSRGHLVCRLLLEKKKDIRMPSTPATKPKHTYERSLTA